MPSFDVVSEVNMQELDNVVNNVKKEVETRYDFRGSETTVNFDKGDKKIRLVTSDEMKMRAIQEMLQGHCVRRKVDPKFLEFKDIEPTSKGMVKREIAIREGIAKDIASKLVKAVKESKLKVQTAIQDDQLRVTGKKIDDLQEVIQILRDADCGIPLDFVNMRS